MVYIRSILFNILFYGVWTPFVCLAMLPSLIMPRKFTVAVAAMYQYGVYLLAKYIVGLDFEVRGREHQPADGQPYIIAAKHQSAYETLLLYQLFSDPTIILKKELLSLPIFGWFLKKLDVIAIDRGKRSSAANSLYEGAKRMRKDGRPIVIFPQGTRVRVDATSTEKPYKSGITRLYTVVELPILPMAINTGLYWPRNSFWKYPGKAIIEFLPLIPAGLPEDEVLKKLETDIEAASKKLIEEGRAARKA